jgi:hypothetical protein
VRVYHLGENMKKVITILTMMIFFFSLPILTYAGKQDKRYKNRNEKRVEQRYDNRGHGNAYGHDKHGHPYGIYKKNHNYRYRNYKYKRHYTWREWDRHRHNRYYRHGRYHMDDNKHLMFSFCEQTGICFSFSIGD